MPATLGHIALQVPFGRVAQPGIDAKWLLAGCIIPDVPWIFQRAALAAGSIPPIELRLYCIALSSLAFCFVLCAAVACFSHQPRRIFLCLAMASIVHLLLDSLEIKWANGVVLTAPVEWKLSSLALYWPEAWPAVVLMALGCVVCSWLLWRERPSGDDLVLPRGWRVIPATCCLAIYCLGPIVFLPDIRAADLHGTETLSNMEERAGKAIAFDRRPVELTDTGAVLATWTGERLSLANVQPERAGIYSLQGHFLDTDTIAISSLHLHPDGRRDIAAYAGLSFVVFWWCAVLLRRIPPCISASRMNRP